MRCSVKADEVNFLSDPTRRHPDQGKYPDDKVIGAQVSTGDRDLMTVERPAAGRADNQHREVRGDGARGKGRELLQTRSVRAGNNDGVTVPCLKPG